MSADKTNAMRLLDRAKLTYDVLVHPGDEFTDGVTLADALGQPRETVYKTIVTVGADKGYYVFVVPVEKEIDLKAAARAAGVKSISMLPLAKLTEVTGYIRGGCSPLAMKKKYKTFIDTSAEALAKIWVCGGKRGVQLGLAPGALARAAEAAFAPLCAE